MSDARPIFHSSSVRSRRTESDDDAEPTRRTLKGDFHRIESETRRILNAADESVRQQVELRPLMSVGVAFGLGILLAGGLPRGVISALIAMGGRATAMQLQSALFSNGGSGSTGEAEEAEDST